MDKVSYDYYRIFYYVAKYGSISHAAEILRSNQPNITKYMNNLDSQLGCRLITRSNNRITLTPEGQKLNAHLAKFRAAYPGIRLYITNGSTSSTAAALHKGLLDLAVVTSPIDFLPDIQSTHLLTFEEVLVAAASSDFSQKRRITPSEVFSYPIVSLGRHAKTYDFYSHLFLPYGLEWQPDIDLATSDQILPMIKAGLGIGFVPEFMAKRDLEQKTIVPIEVIGLKAERAIVLLEDKTKCLSAAAAALKQMMLSEAET